MGFQTIHCGKERDNRLYYQTRLGMDDNSLETYFTTFFNDNMTLKYIFDILIENIMMKMLDKVCLSDGYAMFSSYDFK